MERKNFRYKCKVPDRSLESIRGEGGKRIQCGFRLRERLERVGRRKVKFGLVRGVDDG